MTRRHFGRGASVALSFVAFFSLGSLFFAFLLAASPAWHQHFHSDAAQPQHECAITVVESGTELNDSAPVPTAPRLVTQISTIRALNPVWVAAPFSGAHVFEHAPPALS